MTTCNPTETKTWVRSAAESQVLRNYTCHYFFHFHFLHTFFLFLFFNPEYRGHCVKTMNFLWMDMLPYDRFFSYFDRYRYSSILQNICTNSEFYRLVYESHYPFISKCLASICFYQVFLSSSAAQYTLSISMAVI